MACDIDIIPLSAGFCELREKINEVVEATNENCEAIASKGLRLEVAGTSSDNDNITDFVKNITFSGTPIDPLSGYSLNKRYTVQAGDDGLFLIIAQAGFSGQTTGSTGYALDIRVNNAPISAVSMQLFDNLMQHRPQVVTFVNLVAGDFIEVGGLGVAVNNLGIFGNQNALKITKL